MNNLVTMDKQYKTRDGRAVRVLCVDREDINYPVVALIISKHGDDIAMYTKDGYCESGVVTDNKYDLIEQPEEKTVWLEIYRYKYWTSESSDQSCIHYSLADLETSINPKFRSKDYQLIAVKKVVYKEGDRE